MRPPASAGGHWLPERKFYGKVIPPHCPRKCILAAFAATFDDAPPEDVIELLGEQGEYPVDRFGRALILGYYTTAPRSTHSSATI